MAVPLLMTMVVVVVLLPSSYSYHMDRKMCQRVNKAAKVRGDGFTLPKNASGLLNSFPTCTLPPTPPDALLDYLWPQLCAVGAASTSAQTAILMQNLLSKQVHLFFVVAGGWVDCGGSFSLLNLVAS